MYKNRIYDLNHTSVSRLSSEIWTIAKANICYSQQWKKSSEKYTCGVLQKDNVLRP